MGPSRSRLNAQTPGTEGIGPARGGHVATYLLKRLGLALITLWLLSLIVFFAGQVLPGDPGRSILGPLADPRAVAALDHQLGVDKPLISQYLSWIGGLLHGDMGTSYQFREPVAPFIGAALVNSIKLGALAFVIVVPLGILGGILAALNVGRATDRVISVAGLSAATVPEFVSGIVLFGYIARMARAGMIEALDSDYARTATLKGLKRSVVIRRHLLRNALLPTITVIATQTGYLIGGLVVVETLFNYQGIGNLIYK